MVDYKPQISDHSLPPQNVEAEELILGGILFDPRAIARVADLLICEVFYVKSHGDIYQAALTLHQQGKPTDLMTVSAWLEDQHLLEKVGGLSRLAQLIERTVSAANIDRYAAIIIDKYLRRQLINAGQDIVTLGHDTTIELESVFEESEKKIFNLTQKRPQEGLVQISEPLMDAFTEMELMQQKLLLPGIPSGFYDLDAMTGGFQRSDLIIVAGRPSMGKTSFALNIAHSIAKDKKGVAIFSLEMSKEQLAQRLLASEAQIDSNRLRSGRFGQNEYEKLARALGTISSLPIYINDQGNISVAQMRSQMRRLQSEQKVELGLVLLDYLQLMEGNGSDNRVQELSRITRSLKALAREVNAPVIALSQLSRAVEARQNKRPMMSDLRESGCLSGESLVELADTGVRVPIRNLVGQSGFAVWALNETTMKLEKAIVSKAFCTGIKPVFRLTTRLGRTIRATANHKFLTISGWKRLDELNINAYIALPRYLSSPSLQTMSDAELALLGHLIGDGCTLPRHSIQYTTKENDLAHLVSSLATEVFAQQLKPRIVQERQWYQVYLTSSYPLTHNVKNPVTKWLDNLGIFGLRSYEKFIPSHIFEQPQEAIAIFWRHLWSTDGCLKLIKGLRPISYYTSKCLSNSDVYWDNVISIKPDGETEVYDLTVSNLHNFVANNIIVHNSIEQDADLVIMLYRDEYYHPDSHDRGVAEVIIAKHRNGPTGQVKLLFKPEFTQFFNLQQNRSTY